ncbi:MAG: hypothetical protein ABSD21_04055 [Rhizomicrobium sp.]
MLIRVVAFVVCWVTIFAFGSLARRIVRKNAPFYAPTNILIVGSVYGTALALVVGLIPHFFIGSWWATVVLWVIGFLAANYIGYQFDKIDWAEKSGQTAMIAAATYIILTVGLFLLL